MANFNFKAEDLRVDSIAVMLPGPQSKVAGSIPLGSKLNLIVRTRLGITEVIQDVRSVQCGTNLMAAFLCNVYVPTGQ